MTSSYQQAPFFKFGPVGRAHVPPWRLGRRMPVVPTTSEHSLKMHLLGHYFNHPSSPPQAIFDALPDEPLEPTERPEPPPETGRLGNGVVQRAVVKVLAAADGPSRAADIHLAVERLLGRVVSKESVSCALHRGIRGSTPRFERVSVGYYRFRAA
jgi:hypothetical protein